MPDVFISYFTGDAERANSLAAALHKHAGLSSFVDTEALDVGDHLHERIERAIGRSAALCVLMTEQAASRPWVRTEIELARQARARVIVLHLGGPPPSGDVLELDARTTWTTATVVPAELIAAIAEAVKITISLVPGYTGRAHGFELLLSGALRRDHRSVSTRQDDPDRALHWYADKVRQDPGARAVFVIDFHDPSHSCEQYMALIDGARQLRAQRFKPMFALLHVPGVDDPARIPSVLSRYFRISPASTEQQLREQWQRIKREWDDKPHSS
jgi:hypothetical protein